MLIEGKELLIEPLTEVFNMILNNEEKIPRSWRIGDIVSIYKGKGSKHDLKNQRGISLASAVLKCLEKVLSNRIEENIRKYSTNLQGGGKKGEATEEYILIINTIVEYNQSRGKNTKIIITDVEKAFDHAWRKGIFVNLAQKGIEGKILNLMWQINNNLISRIKYDEEIYSEEFNVEDSLRQGGGLSAILYAQHVGKIIENCVERKIGTKINEEHIPAVGWQDDVTILAEDSKMEKELIEEIEKTAKKQRIKFSADKCKYIKIGRKKMILKKPFYPEENLKKLKKEKS